jgi:thiamine biosynthesis lipoprotein
MAAGVCGLGRGPACGPADAGPWEQVTTGDDAVAVAERGALGTSARVAVWPPGNLGAACAATDDVLAALDRQASRFRPDSELSWLHAAGGGMFLLSDGLAEAVGVALAAARWTGGLTDPTVGDALISLGYDRDFAAIDPDSERPGAPVPGPVPAPGWRLVRLDGRLLRLPGGIRLDLGATAKGVGSDRAARAVMSATGYQGGVLVSLGGDIAVAGTPPRDGWPVTVAEEPDEASPPGGQLVRLAAGAVATSSVTVRRWRRGGAARHHIVDPRTGYPADGPWRTVTVAAATCADANAASTAAIVAGAAAPDWLAAAGLPARLTGHDGRVRGLNGWPGPEAGAGAPVPAHRGSHVYAGGPR